MITFAHKITRNEKTGILALLLIGIYSCGNSNEFKVIGSAEGVEDGKKILIRKQGEYNQLAVIDTLEVKEGKFTYEGIIEIPEMNYLYIEGVKGNIPVVIEPGKINITAYKDSLRASNIEGTPYNNDYSKLTASFKKLSLKNNDLRARMLKANRERDSSVIDGLREEYAVLQQESLDIQNNFIKENPQSYVVALLLKQLASKPENIDVGELQRMYDALPKNIKATKEAREVAMKLSKLSKTNVGGTPP